MCKKAVQIKYVPSQASVSFQVQEVCSLHCGGISPGAWKWCRRRQWALYSIVVGRKVVHISRQYSTKWGQGRSAHGLQLSKEVVH